MIGVLFFLGICASGVLAGSKCPIRQVIYPCTCSNLHLSRKKMLTTVTCVGVKNTDQLRDLLPIFNTMDIDQLQLYDTFWEANKLGAAGESQKVLPREWLNSLKTKEIHIIDSTMSPCFACQLSSFCRNPVINTFTLVNSTSADKICTLCDSGNRRLPWMGCLTKLKNFELSYGNLKTLTVEFFPLIMRELRTLRLAHNLINKIDGNALKNVPSLKTLDLSYNRIEHIDHTFGQRTELEYLDISFNAIKMVGGDLVPLMPKIKSFNFAHNSIVQFKESDWKKAPLTLRTIDLTGNPISCDCSLIWVNSSLLVHVSVPGICATPDDFNASPIRQASRLLTERCDARGNLLPQKIKTH